LGELSSAYPRSYANAINDLGQITGGAYNDSGIQRAFIFDAGGMRELGGLVEGGASVGMAINNAGHVAGYASLAAAGKTHAFFYKDGALRDLGALKGADSEAHGLNNYGQIVGASAGRGFLYQEGKLYDLNAWVKDLKGWTIIDAVAINDAGQIAANGLNAAGELHALLLTPFTADQTFLLAHAKPGLQAPARAKIASVSINETADLSVALTDNATAALLIAP
jgi:probable HAF family extracellular repeat protein